MAPPPPPSQEPDDESWLVTYADAITLLMAFFVLFISFSKIDLDIYDQVRHGVGGEFSSKATENELEKLQESLQDIVLEQEIPDAVSVSTDSRGITIELDANAFFKPGSAELAEGAAAILDSTFEEVSAPIYDRFNIQVEGHTDDDPISTPKFPSNWELSTARASTVVRFLINKEMDPKRFKATGFADTQPKVPNRDVNGDPIPENQARNRRVIVRINRDQLFVPIKIPKFRRDAADQRSVPLR